LDPKDWNESVVLEDITSAARSMGGIHLFTDVVDMYSFTDGYMELPAKVKYLGQIFIYKPSINKNTSQTNEAYLAEQKKLIEQRTSAPSADFFINNFPTESRNKYGVVYESPSHILSPCKGINTCHLQFKQIDNKLCFNVNSGIVLIEYKKYSENSDGEYIIPDNETYKRALVHYCLYKYNDRMMRSNPSVMVQNERRWNLERFSLLSQRAVAEVNEPTINTLEAIRKNQNKLVGNMNLFETNFSNYGNPINGI
jgi:hypothetical protein